MRSAAIDSHIILALSALHKSGTIWMGLRQNVQDSDLTTGFNDSLTEGETNATSTASSNC